MQIRRVTSLTALVSFVLLILTSIILYIVPAGRVAYWADWRLWGLTKEQWGAVHINGGVLFLAAIALHLWYNWKPITNYMKNKAKQLRLTADLNAAILVCALFVVGTLAMVPPFSWILDASEHIKDQGAATYGEPPYGHAELSSIKTFAARMGFDAAEAVARLKEAGVAVDGETQTILAVAQANGLAPKTVYERMRPAQSAEAGPEPFPASPPGGFGNRTLADVCAAYGLNQPTVLRALAAQDIKAESGKTIKEIATANNVGPMDLFEALKAIAAAN